MKEFGNELRAHREARRASLADISSLTKIHPRYLQAMEEGDYSFLPSPYVRAFLCDYAKVLELDPDEILHRYEAALEASTRVPEVQVARRRTPWAPSSAEEEVPSPRTGIVRSLWLSLRGLFAPGGKGKKFLPAAGVVFVLLAIVLVANLTRNPRKSETTEIPFEQVVKEKEQTATALPESAGVGGSGMNVAFAFDDSLLLEGKTTNDVWMRIYIDNGPSMEYLLGPNRVQSWKAKERFRVSLGNAGGINFTLNGRQLGALGKSGAVVQNIVITREGVQR